MNNYSDVIAQITAFGLHVDRLEVGRMVRCKVEGDKEKRGWYILHQVTLNGGETVLVGSYGIWQGSENNAQKIDLQKTELSPEQKSAIKKRIAEDAKKAAAQQKFQQERAAKKAESVWKKLLTEGDCEYLRRKAVANHGGRFSAKGAFIIPLLDTTGRIHGLQFILDKVKHREEIAKRDGKDKQFWPPGLSKKSHFHLMGLPADVLLITEGYATGASLHEATGLPVAIAFDAGNFPSVADALKKRYPQTKFLFCADDDAFSRCKHCQKPVKVNESSECQDCKKPHGKENAGQKYAEIAALAVNGRVIAPKFADENARWEYYCKNQGKLTDFNDLHITDGLHTVRSQIEATLFGFGWSVTVKAGAVNTRGGGGNDEKHISKPIAYAEELLDRYALVYGMGGMLFDYYKHMRISMIDMKQLCTRPDISRGWQESLERKVVDAEQVGFDPTEKNPDIICNTWAGWPTQPKQGDCELLLDLLMYMCGNEKNQQEVYDWVLKWLAYPLQHPGAKMKTTVVIHGGQGTGKNLFFDAVLKIYGKYGRVIDQSAIEDKFNDCFSGKLFMLADEVVARSDLYHVKNKLKGLITGDRIRINPKNMAAYEETNHVNMVFLSNERMPVVLEQDDRRHMVLWTPPKINNPTFYKDIAHEIANGGSAALHYFLLNLDLGDFNPDTKPVMTVAKLELQDLSRDSVTQFYAEWNGGHILGVSPIPALSDDVFKLYLEWCKREVVKPRQQSKVMDAIGKIPGAKKEYTRYQQGFIAKQYIRMVVFPSNAEEMNPGNSRGAWIGEKIEEFKEMLKDYIEN